MNIVLLGDSIFDNQSYVVRKMYSGILHAQKRAFLPVFFFRTTYVGNGPDVVAQLRQQLPDHAQATLCAVDGNVAGDVERQLQNVPSDATHLFISAGGNDALLNVDVLEMKVASSREVFTRLAAIAGEFEARYRAMLHRVLSLKLPTTLCTIYYPRMEEDWMQKISVAGLATFNDIIIKQAFVARVPLIDLRLVCDEAGDYANEIEPSVQGGAKIARAIARVANEHDFEQQQTRIYF